MASIDDWMWDLDDGLSIDPVLGAHLDVALASEGRDSTAGGFWLFPDGADLTTQILAELEASTAATARIRPAIEDTPRQSDGRAPSAEQAGSAAGTAHSGSIHVNLEHVVETPLANPQTLPQRRGEASSLRTTSPIAPVAAVSAGQTVVPPAVGVSATVPSQHASTAGVVASLPAASSPPSNLRPREAIIGSTGGAQPAPQAALNTEAGAAPTKRTASGKARRRRVRAPGVSTVYERRYVPLFYACTLHAAGLTRWLGCMRRSGDVHASRTSLTNCRSCCSPRMLWTAWTTGDLHHRRLVVLVVMIWLVALALEIRAPQSASECARRKRYVARSDVRCLPVVRDVSSRWWLYDVVSQAVLQAAVTAVTKMKSQAIQRPLPGSAPCLKLGSTSKPGVFPRDRNSMLALGHALAQYVVCAVALGCGGTPRWTLTRRRAEICCESTRRPPSSRLSHSCTSVCRCSMRSVQARGIHSRCPKPNPGWRTRMA